MIFEQLQSWFPGEEGKDIPSVPINQGDLCKPVQVLSGILSLPLCHMHASKYPMTGCISTPRLLLLLRGFSVCPPCRLAATSRMGPSCSWLSPRYVPLCVRCSAQPLPSAGSSLPRESTVVP